MVWHDSTAYMALYWIFEEVKTKPKIKRKEPLNTSHVLYYLLLQWQYMSPGDEANAIDYDRCGFHKAKLVRQ